MSKFNERLKELRLEKGLSRKALAEKLNITERAISYWENGSRECDFDTLIVLANLFSCSIDYLIGNSEY